VSTVTFPIPGFPDSQWAEYQWPLAEADYEQEITDAMGIDDRLERRAVYVRGIMDAIGIEDSLGWAWTTPDQLQLILELTRRVEAELSVTRQVEAELSVTRQLEITLER